MEYTCLSCMAYVLRELGDWDARGRAVPGAAPCPAPRPTQTLVADGVLGMIRAFRGDLGCARPLLVKSLETARA